MRSALYRVHQSEYIPEADRDKWLIKPHDYKALATLIDRQIKRPGTQTLQYPCDINVLVRSYLSYLAEMHPTQALS